MTDSERPSTGPETDALGSADPAASSVAGKSVARFIGEGAAAFFMALTGVVVARSLGPDGKGIVAALSFLVTLFALVAALGLGDAAIIMVGRRRAQLRTVARVTMFVAPLAGILAAVLLYPALALQFSHNWTVVRSAVLLGVLAVPFLTVLRALTGVVESQGRIAAAAAAYVLTAACTAIATVAFVRFLRFDVTGAAAAMALGPVAGCTALIAYARTQGIPTRPQWDRNYVLSALRLGVPAQSAYVLSAISARVDILIVYMLLGSISTGHYSVALTLGHLVSYAPAALAIASFPVLAHGDSPSFRVLSVRLVRATLILGLLSAAALAVLIPLVTVPIFGHGFRPSITPALVLLVGGLIASAQWLLCRIAAARGQTGLLFRSYLLSVVIMVLLDFALIPPFGIMGAAVASIVGPAAGVAVAYPNARRIMALESSRQLVPHLGDVRTMWAMVKQTARLALRRR